VAEKTVGIVGLGGVERRGRKSWQTCGGEGKRARTVVPVPLERKKPLKHTYSLKERI